MIRTLLLRGLLVGLVAGLIAAAFAYLLGEPNIDQAIALEEAASHAQSEAGHSHGEEALVSRSGQRAGLFLALALYGMSVGGVFSLVFAGLRGRIGPRSDAVLAATMAATAFVALVLVPFVKYPANPPAVGDPDTIGSRTVLYLVLVAIGLLSVAVGVACARKVPARPWLAGVAGFLVPVIVTLLVLPTVNEVPDGFPAQLLWDFRVSSLGTQLVLWSAIGVLYGIAVQRVVRRDALAAAPN
ncbi:CbtA family protein [Streptosporangium sp. NPDC049248]|uniref:CbtA family protein n=1 Tax=Streptosporangium sp. NPDC049248 TaxID=3155651 RepID=UPI0034326D91